MIIVTIIVISILIIVIIIFIIIVINIIIITIIIIVIIIIIIIKLWFSYPRPRSVNSQLVSDTEKTRKIDLKWFFLRRCHCNSFSNGTNPPPPPPRKTIEKPDGETGCKSSSRWFGVSGSGLEDEG